MLITLGDARGHGLEAATLMAKLRYALAGSPVPIGRSSN
ncbi:hypothetical protein [Streptomyces sp. NPDC002855]